MAARSNFAMCFRYWPDRILLVSFHCDGEQQLGSKLAWCASGKRHWRHAQYLLVATRRAQGRPQCTLEMSPE